MNLKEFVLYMGQNPYKVIAAKQDADAIIEEADLSEEDRAILTSGDPKRIIEAIQAGETPIGALPLG